MPAPAGVSGKALPLKHPHGQESVQRPPQPLDDLKAQYRKQAGEVHRRVEVAAHLHGQLLKRRHEGQYELPEHVKGLEAGPEPAQHAVNDDGPLDDLQKDVHAAKNVVQAQHRSIP